MRKFFLPLLPALALTACSSAPSYEDGTYRARSFADSHGARAEVTLTVLQGRFQDVVYVTRQSDGKLKDETYGMGLDKEGESVLYESAQRAVKAMPLYRQQFLDSQSLEGVDAISGATTSYEQFKDALQKCLDRARR